MNVVAINTSPRVNWNTDLAVKEAAKGAASVGAEIQIQYFDLYRLKNVSGCVSCFGCKRPPHEGHCVKQDDLTAVLEAIREAAGVIIGTPNYLGQPSAGFMQLFERLCYQNITYRKPEEMKKAFRLGTELVSGNWLATHRLATPDDPII